MRLLVIEDEEKLANSLKKALESESYAVDIALEGDIGFEKAFDEEYDLIILDLGLPGMDGIDIARNLRKEGIKTPILMLTARDTLKDKIKGLDSGADDYLVKPFEFSELLARVRSQLRRSQQNTSELILQVEDLSLDPKAHIVKRGKSQIDLSAKEYALLEYLMRNKGSIVNRGQIIDHVWDSELNPFSNVVDVYIGYLRKKIDEAFPKKKPLIYTKRGIGYKVG